jgi:acyl-ACP thioesterase
MHGQGEKQKIWKDRYTIRSYDADASGKAAVPALCRLLQETAYHHAANLGMGYENLLENGTAWVLSRQYVRVFRAPAWGETVTLATWPAERERLFWYREFEMTADDGQTLLTAATAWIVVNLKTRRPQRTDTYAENDAYASGRSHPQKPGKLKALSAPESLLSLHPVYFDMDVVGHVNNTRYVEWVLGALPREFHQNNRLTELEINFLSETGQGQTLEVRSQRISDTTLGHDIIRPEDGQEVIRVRSSWEPSYSRD